MTDNADVWLLYEELFPKLLYLFPKEPKQQRVINHGDSEHREGTCCSLTGTVLMNVIKLKIRKTSMTTSALEKLPFNPKENSQE